MNKVIGRAVEITAIIVFLLAWWHFMTRDGSRIVIREDGQYEVELCYGPLGWSEMGGPFATIEEARAKVAYWKQHDEDKRREKAIKRRVVETP